MIVAVAGSVHTFIVLRVYGSAMSKCKRHRRAATQRGEIDGLHIAEIRRLGLAGGDTDRAEDIGGVVRAGVGELADDDVYLSVAWITTCSVLGAVVPAAGTPW